MIEICEDFRQFGINSPEAYGQLICESARLIGLDPESEDLSKEDMDGIFRKAQDLFLERSSMVAGIGEIKERVRSSKKKDGGSK